MASNVDLPAPLGPISPVSVPARTENDTSSTARTPPNSRETPTASSTTSPGRASGTAPEDLAELPASSRVLPPATSAGGGTGTGPDGGASGRDALDRPSASAKGAAAGAAAAGTWGRGAPGGPS